jgi:putative membrane protein
LAASHRIPAARYRIRRFALQHCRRSGYEGGKGRDREGQVFSSIVFLPNFLLFFMIAAVLVAAYLLIYTLVTAHNELVLIRQNVVSAALALGLSLVGFALPLSSAVVYATNVIDLVIWGFIAILVQIAAYGLVRVIVPNLSQRIAAGELSAAIFLGAVSLTAGIVNAAAMTF